MARADWLVARGFAAGDALSRDSLLGRAEDGLHRLTGADARWRSLVPGRLEVFGKHTDYGGGRTLVAAVPRGFAFAAAPRPDGIVRVWDVGNGDRCEIHVAHGDVLRGWRNYVAVTARRLAVNFPGASLGVDVAFVSDLPRAAGMSSSSALVVGLASVLVARGQLSARREWSAEIPALAQQVEYFGSIENGSSYRSLAGARGVGTEGGSEDHAAILMSRGGCLTEISFMPLEPVGTADVAADWTFVIASSGVHADKAGTVRDRYNRAARTARAIVDVWNRANGAPARSLAEALAGGADAEERLRRAIRQAGSHDVPGADLERRLDHFVRENGRVPDATAAFISADAARLGELAAASQEDAATLLGNQVAETNDLVEAARATGALAASSFGAGFGGSVWALVPIADAPAFGDAWRRAYLARHPSRTSAQWFAARPAPAMIDVPIGA